MRSCLLLLALVLGVSPLWSLEAASAKIVKVLPHYLDREGRIALSPSLFERDAYQAILRRDKSLCSALRFDVNWKARTTAATDLKVRLELVTSTVSRDRPLVIEQPVRLGASGRRWTRVALEGQTFREAGEIIAWRISILEGERTLADQRSFLW